MRKLVIFLVAILLITACKKTEKEPLGPTDIRVTNLSNVTMNELTVETGGGIYNFGILEAGDTTDYFRFEVAYPKANISALINGDKYKTDTVIYAYMQYLGQVKATYEIFIESDALRKLKIHNVIMESPLK
ncbi:MAG: hypothetical protein KBG40_00905 [Bacteroidales bacterium]|nr:hypothetical protein [Bacteroidales bacterium]